MLEVHPIFQTPIFVCELNGITDACDLEPYIRKCCSDTPGKFEHGMVVQSRYDLNRDEKLAPLCREIFEIARSIAQSVYRYSPNYVVEITSMWGNIQKPGCFFPAHIHHNNVFSGVFYLNDDDGFPPVTFWRPTETMLDPKKQEYNVFNQGSFRRPVKKDTLIMFPAWLNHSVDINTTARDRVGISFNLMLRGEYYNTRM